MRRSIVVLCLSAVIGEGDVVCSIRNSGVVSCRPFCRALHGGKVSACGLVARCNVDHDLVSQLGRGGPVDSIALGSLYDVLRYEMRSILYCVRRSRRP